VEGKAADCLSFLLNLKTYLLHAITGQEDVFVACLYQWAELPEAVSKGGEREGGVVARKGRSVLWQNRVEREEMKRPCKDNN
jgi:hypothetical protein